MQKLPFALFSLFGLLLGCNPRPLVVPTPVSMDLPLFRSNLAKGTRAQRLRSYLQMRATSFEDEYFVGGRQTSQEAMIRYLSDNRALEEAAALQGVRNSSHGWTVVELVAIFSSTQKAAPVIDGTAKTGHRVLWDDAYETLGAFNQRLAAALRFGLHDPVPVSGIHGLPGPYRKIDLSDLRPEEQWQDWLPAYTAVNDGEKTRIGGIALGLDGLIQYLQIQGEIDLAQRLIDSLTKRSWLFDHQGSIDAVLAEYNARLRAYFSRQTTMKGPP